MSQPSNKKVTILCGNMGFPSNTHGTLQTVETMLHTAGIQTQLVCVHEHSLPLFDPTVKPCPEIAQHVCRWIREADGLVVGSPEYHGSLSGSLKNLIDYLQESDVKGKPVALVSVAGGGYGGINTLNGLRLIFRALYAPAIVEQAAVSEKDFDEQKIIVNPKTLKQLERVTDGLLRELRR